MRNLIILSTLLMVAHIGNGRSVFDSFIGLPAQLVDDNDQCRTSKFNRTIIVAGCLPITITDAMCFGMCTSETVTKFVDLKSVTTQVCKFCRPVEFENRQFKLNCPGRKKQIKKERITLRCECIHDTECGSGD